MPTIIDTFRLLYLISNLDIDPTDQATIIHSTSRTRTIRLYIMRQWREKSVYHAANNLCPADHHNQRHGNSNPESSQANSSSSYPSYHDRQILTLTATTTSTTP